MKIAVIGTDEKISRMLLSEIQKYKNVDLEFYTEFHEQHSFDIRGYDAFFVSVYKGNEEYISTLSKKIHTGIKKPVFLIGDHTSQVLFLYTYKCEGFILMKRMKDDIPYVVNKLREQIPKSKNVFITTFGRFEVFVNGKAVAFKNRKARELLALCVDHKGKFVTIEEATDKLWPNRFYDENVKQLYRKAVQYLIRVMNELGANDVFEKIRGACRINTDNIECDYYQFLEDPEYYASLFNGNYMFEYSWAENMIPILENLQKKSRKHNDYCSDDNGYLL